MNLFRYALLTLLVLHGPVRADTLVPADFASGLPLPEVMEGSIYSLTLPLAVYGQVIHPDLGDIRVFNGAGEPVPHALRRPETRPEIQESRQPLPFFPLQCEPDAQEGNVALRVSRSASGTIVHVDAGSEHRPLSASCFLLDASGLTTPPTALELDWTGGPDSLFTVSLSQSPDLTHWSPLSSRTVLADLRHDGQAIAVHRIPLSGRVLRYLRLDCTDCRPPLEVREVMAVIGGPAVPSGGDWLRPETSGMNTEGQETIFTSAPIPAVTVTGLRVALPETNSLARVAIESRPTEQSPWRSRHQGLLYDLTLDGKRLTSEPVPCPATTDRYWRVRILHDGAGLGKHRPPRLELGWQADQVLFVARGQGPYLLAFGSGKVGGGADPQENLILAALRQAGSEALIRPIQPGPVQILSGEAARTPRLSGDAWKRWLLWVVLIGGVVLLAGMTRVMLGEMKRN